MKKPEKKKKVFSMEFFPPKTEEGVVKLGRTRDELAALGPEYFSVTFGAGGSTQQGTMETVFSLKDAGYEVAPHLSCIGSTRSEVLHLLKTYMDKGIDRIVALRGDLPSGMGVGIGDFRYANELVQFIREETGDHFYIEVAAYPEIHPQATDAESDLDNFAGKVKAGADSAITQYFYNADAYFRFIDECAERGVQVPIVPGIMPITNYEQLARFSDTCGAEIPRWLRKRLEGYGSDLELLRKFGIDVTTDLCQRLLDGGAPGLHFFTMNQVAPTTAIWKALGI
ncbi:MAG: methylenetetrahydrofolate reductase [NAD(P)H] [Deltaproteobacteria bacterium]|nr:methylenetetrahydrofolate reductase [NAD(P)H] [Deltaproteobacteria bacterium]